MMAPSVDNNYSLWQKFLILIYNLFITLYLRIFGAAFIISPFKDCKACAFKIFLVRERFSFTIFISLSS